jgi:hypothetical protein
MLNFLTKARHPTVSKQTSFSYYIYRNFLQNIFKKSVMDRQSCSLNFQMISNLQTVFLILTLARVHAYNSWENKDLDNYENFMFLFRLTSSQDTSTQNSIIELLVRYQSILFFITIFAISIF